MRHCASTLFYRYIEPCANHLPKPPTEEGTRELPRQHFQPLAVRSFFPAPLSKIIIIYAKEALGYIRNYRKKDSV
jgi:hypothetical protein